MADEAKQAADKVSMSYDISTSDGTGRVFIQVRETTTKMSGLLKGQQTVKTGFAPWEASTANKVVAALKEGKLTALLGKRIPNQTLYTVMIIDPTEAGVAEETAEETADKGELKHEA